MPTSGDIQVLLDDGSGTYPTDVTASVRMVDGVSVSSVGRTDEFSTAQASSLTLVLDNQTGTYSSGAIAPLQGIRWREYDGAAWHDRFTGRVSALDLEWPDGGQEFSTIGVTAMDPLADLGRFPLRSMLEQEILLRSPSVYYTLGEASGSTTAGDTSGNQGPTLTAAGTGAAFTMGTGTGPGVDGLTATQFFGGQWLQSGDGSDTGIAIGSTFGLVVAFATTTTPAAQSFLAYDGRTSARIAINSAGTLSAIANGLSVIGGGSSVVDGRTHVAALVGDGSTASLLLDGAVVATGAYTASGDRINRFQVGAIGDGTSLQNVLVGTVSHVAAFPTLTTTDALTIWEMSTSTFTETTAQRLARICSYTGATSSTTTGMSGQLMPTQATSGGSALDALQAVADAEAGLLYADGDGTIVLQGRYLRALNTTPDLTLTADDLDPSTAVTWDTQQLVNQVTASRTNGATIVVGSTTGEIYPQSLNLTVAADDDARFAAEWVLNKHDATSPRIATLTFDLLAPSTASRAQLLGLNLGDRIALSGMPSQLWSGSGDMTIEGWAETHSLDEWSLTANVLPFALSQAAVWDDPGSKWDNAVWAQ